MPSNQLKRSAKGSFLEVLGRGAPDMPRGGWLTGCRACVAGCGGFGFGANAKGSPAAEPLPPAIATAPFLLLHAKIYRMLCIRIKHMYQGEACLQGGQKMNPFGPNLMAFLLYHSRSSSSNKDCFVQRLSSAVSGITGQKPCSKTMMVISILAPSL